MKEYIGDKQYLFVGKLWELRQLIQERKEALKP